MLLPLAHFALAITALWYHRSREYAPKSVLVVLGWYLVSLALIGIDLLVSEGASASLDDFLRGAMVSLFQLPPLFFALQWGKLRRRGLLEPILVYLFFSLAALMAIGLIFARAEIASGLH